MGGGKDQFLAQRPEEAGKVYGARGAGDRFLGGVFGGDHHPQEVDQRRLDALPLGKSTSPATMTYPHSLLLTPEHRTLDSLEDRREPAQRLADSLSYLRRDSACSRRGQCGDSILPGDALFARVNIYSALLHLVEASYPSG